MNKLIKNINWWHALCKDTWPLFLPCLLLAPTLFSGFILDDYFHHAIMHGNLKPFFVNTNPLTDLFAFLPADEPSHTMLKEHGLLPWWTPEGLRANFFRPLTAITHLVDFYLWPHWPFMHHMHNFFWFILATWGLRRLYQTANLSSMPLALALLFFLVEDAHVMSVGWIANRNILVAIFFGCLAIQGFIRWRMNTEHLTWPLFWPLLWMSMSLLSAEAGLGTFGYILAWSIVYESTLRSKIIAIMPFVALIIMWRILYMYGGYGTWGTGLYDDPASDFPGFILMLMQRLPLFILGLWAQIPTEINILLTSSSLWIVSAFGMLVMTYLYFLFRPLLSQDPRARFWALGMIFTLIPFSAALPMNRLLLFAGIGAFALLGLYLNTQINPTRHPLFWIHGPLAILLSFGGVVGFKAFKDVGDLPVKTLPSDLSPHDHIIYLSGATLPAGYTIIKPILDGSTYPARISVLSPLTRAKTLRRLDEHRLEISAQEPWFQLALETIFRSPRIAFGNKRIFQGSGFIATITEADENGAPKTVEFRFEKPLDDPHYRWTCFKDLTLKTCQIPKVGEHMNLPGLLSW